MKKKFFVTALILNLLAFTLSAQTTLKEYKVGHTFSVSLPDYMKRTVGLNTSAAFQYKSVIKDVYGFIIEDIKEELTLAELSYSSINEFYEEFIKTFLKDQEKRKVSKPRTQTKGEINFIEADITYYDKAAETEIYYLVGIAETKTSYYKVLSWATLANKEKFKADFQKILYSVKD